MATGVLVAASKTITKFRPIVLFNRLQGKSYGSLAMDSFIREGIIPDVIKNLPQQKLEVKYPSGAIVELGNVLTPLQVKDKPVVTWTADPNDMFTLCMTDPDAPSRETPKFREWHHWLVGNIPGNEVVKGDTLSDYIGAGPPKGTGKHRYVFLLYKQPGKLTFDEPRLSNKSVEGRPMFKISKFAEKYKLEDPPVAGNFFLAEWDDYVTTLTKELGG